MNGAPIVVKEGRFGAYVTDGETNATLRKADTVEAVTVERAAELLAEKRAARAPGRSGTAKRTAKKAAKKSSGQEVDARRRRRSGPRRPRPSKS